MSRPQDIIGLIQQLRSSSSYPPQPSAYPPPPLLPGSAQDTSGGQMPMRPVGSPQAGLGSPEISRQPAVSPVLPRDPDSRMDLWRNLLTDFVFSLGTGLSARARNPRA